MTLPKLISALEACREPDRELDANIYVATYKGAYPDETKTYRIARALIVGPHYTESLDAALSLVPTITVHSDERHWHVNSQRVGEFHASVYGKVGWYHAVAPSCAVALCLASLRARLAMEGEKT